MGKYIFRQFATFIVGIFLAAFLGFAIFNTMGLDGQNGAILFVLVNVLISFLPMPHGVLSAQLYNELIIKTITENLNFKNTWLSLLTSKPDLVSNNTVKIPKEGADVSGFINNNVWPMPLDNREDDFDIVVMDRFDTKPRSIDRKELQVPYDVEGSEIRFHRRTLEKMSRTYGLYSLAPASDSNNNPILETTGEDDGTGRKRLTRKDLINFEAKIDALEYEKEGRILVLCSFHKADLKLEDSAFGQTLQTHNSYTGKMADLYYGFRLQEDVYNPKYSETKEKLGYGASPAAGVKSRNASTFFYLPNVLRAPGDVSISVARKEDNPLNKQTIFSCDFYHKVAGFGKSYSATIVDGLV